MAGQVPVQQEPADDSGTQRTTENADLGIVQQGRCLRYGIIVRQIGYKHSHRKTNATQGADTGKRLEIGTGRHFNPPKLHRYPGKCKDSDKFTYNQSQKDRKPNSGKQIGKGQAFEHYSRIGKSKDRYYNVVDRSMQRIFHILQGTDNMIRGILYTL